MSRSPHNLQTGDSLTAWRADAGEVPRFQRLRGNARVEVCVVGGGFTGLAAALRLAEAGLDVILLEAGPVGWGASGRNGGQICTGFAPGHGALEKMVGETQARHLFHLAETGKTLLAEWQRRHGFDCHRRAGMLLTAATTRHARGLEEDLRELERAGHAGCRIIDAEELKEEWLGTNAYPAALFDPGAGHLQPLLLCLGLASAAARAGAAICEHTPVLAAREEGDGACAQTPHGEVRARFLVLAANAAHAALFPPLGRFILPVSAWQVATEPLPEELALSVLKRDVAVCDTRIAPEYYRLASLPDGRRRFVFGAGAHYAGRGPRDIAQRLRRRMLRLFPQLRDMALEAAWSGTLAITANRLPHAGRLGERGQIRFAQGFSGQGVVLAPLLGWLMAEDIIEETRGNGGGQAFARLSAIRHRPFPGGPARAWLHAARTAWRSWRGDAD